MEQSFIPRDERILSGLRALYAMRGFRQVRVKKFEEYSLYVENRSFFGAGSMVTFMDADGRLLALKPDVTLSIVKNTPAHALPQAEKLFYIDLVCRLNRENQEYRLLDQIGIELIGLPHAAHNLEVVDLALMSLKTVCPAFVLDISHLGYLSGLLDALQLEQAVREKVLSAFHAKSAHWFARILDKAGVGDEIREKLTQLASLSGNITQVLPRARELVICDQMEQACRELEEIALYAAQCGMQEHIKLDFSVVGHLDYYNGLVFSGYVEGVPEAVLSGGRYDGLMRKMGKESGAIGFAVMLSSISAHLQDKREGLVDIGLTYDAACDFAGVMDKVREWNGQGRSVRLYGQGTPRECRTHWHMDARGSAKEVV